jgi:CubicO group peptidase (beta-lactamase class C family)
MSATLQARLWPEDGEPLPASAWSFRKPLLEPHFALEQRMRDVMQQEAPDSYRFALFDAAKLRGSGAGGWSRSPADPPALKAAVEDRHNIASMSKTITAAAVLNALQEKQLSPDSPVAPFVPPGWTLSATVQTLTFRDFMTHRTGFHWDGKTAFQDRSDLAGIREILAQEPVKPAKAARDYRNINFAVFRILLPFLDAYDPVAKKVPAAFRNARHPEAQLAQRYVEIVNARVLKPAGIGPASCHPDTLRPPTRAGARPAPLTRALAYPYAAGETKGIDPGDRTLTCGASGWCLSVTEIGEVLRNLFFTDKILSGSYREAMITADPPPSFGMGMNREAPVAGSPVYSHGAVIPFGATIDAPMLCGFYLVFPALPLIVVALSNAGHKPPGNPNWDALTLQAVREAFG